MAGRPQDDDETGITWHLPEDWGVLASSPAPPADPKAHAPADPSLRIMGMSYPTSGVPASPGSTSPAQSQDVAQAPVISRRIRRAPLCHISTRIPRKMLDEIDVMTMEQHVGRSQIIRQILARAVKARTRKQQNCSSA